MEGSDCFPFTSWEGDNFVPFFNLLLWAKTASASKMSSDTAGKITFKALKDWKMRPESLFSSSLLSLYTEKLHLSRFTWASLFDYIVSKSLLTVLRDLKKKYPSKSKNQFWSWNVVDEIVLQSPEGESAGSPPATRSSCHPSLRSVDLYPWHYSLNKKKQYIWKKIILIFTLIKQKQKSFSSLRHPPPPLRGRS